MCLRVCTWEEKMESQREDDNTSVKWTWSGWWRYSRVKRNQRMEEGGGWGGGRGLVGGLGVTLMEYHSTFEWWEADNQSDVAPEFISSQASTLSCAINNAIQYLITVNRSQQCYTGIKKTKNIKSTDESGNWFGDSLVELWQCWEQRHLHMYCYYGAPL